MYSAENPVAIIGAGPYGLSIATQLRARGVPFRIFGVPMRTWLQMPATLNLKSFGFATNIYLPQRGFTFPEYCRERGIEAFDPCSIESFAQYGLWVQQRFIPEVEPVDVTSIASCASGFRLSLSSGESLEASRAVIAVGLSYFTRMPDFLNGLPRSLASHTSHHSTYHPFANQDVAVIGAGSSALEASALLHEAGARPQVLVRGPQPLFFDKFNPDRPLRERVRVPNSTLGPGRLSWSIEHFPLGPYYLPSARRLHLLRTHLGPSGAWWLRPRVEGKVPIATRSTIISADPTNGRLRLRIREEHKGERTIEVDHVVAGTGYRPDADRLTFLDPDLRSRIKRLEDAPALSRHFESSVPGLYFVGPVAMNSFGPLMRFVAGAEYTAPAIARHLAGQGLGRLRGYVTSLLSRRSEVGAMRHS